MLASTENQGTLPQDGAALLGQLLSGQTLGDLLGHSRESQEALYYVAHTLYSQAKYADAMRTFAYLLTLNHLDRRSFLGFAACLRMQQRHADALKYYGIASAMDLTDPQPPLHMAECHLALGDRARAQEALNYALSQARGQEAHRACLARIEAIQSFLDTDKEKSHV
jgi:type III secretion system low calcium response chaperone LcrH/SycD